MLRRPNEDHRELRWHLLPPEAHPSVRQLMIDMCSNENIGCRATVIISRDGSPSLSYRLGHGENRYRRCGAARCALFLDTLPRTERCVALANRGCRSAKSP